MRLCGEGEVNRGDTGIEQIQQRERPREAERVAAVSGAKPRATIEEERGKERKRHFALQKEAWQREVETEDEKRGRERKGLPQHLPYA